MTPGRRARILYERVAQMPVAARTPKTMSRRMPTAATIL
jgi:hypothetical protein